jgi:large repetitive protein
MMRLHCPWGRSGIAALLACGGLVLAFSAASAQPAYLVKDVNTGQTGTTEKWPFLTEFVELGSQVVFAVEDGAHGHELWITDGTETGTRLLKDVCPGARSSAPVWQASTGLRMFFTADDCAHGRELWVTDGTPEGTSFVIDLTPGLTGSSVGWLTTFGSSVAFSADDVWISDGTAAGTTRLTDLSPVLSYEQPAIWTAVGSQLFFIADDSPFGKELWVTDGTLPGTHMVKDIRPGSASAKLIDQRPIAGAMHFAAKDGRLFFGADDGMNGFELWTSDGTEAGTTLLADITPGAASSSLSGFLTVGPVVYFAADDGTHGWELWKTDGTPAGTVLVKDIRPPGAFSPGSSNPRDLTAVGSTLYFMATDDADGTELWRSDGTEAGTTQVKDILPGPGNGLSWYNLTLLAVGDDLVFFADDGIHGMEPWVSDGTEAGTSLLADVQPGANGSIFEIYGIAVDTRLVSEGRWYFRAYESGWTAEVWTSDGTPAGTHRLKRIHSQRSALEPFVNWIVPQSRPLADLGGTLIFQGNDGIGAELWRTDGTAAGSVPLAEFVPGSAGALAQEMTSLGSSVLFGVGDLYSTDGTSGGTGLVKNFDLYLTEFTRLGNLVLFSVDDELWRSDGTAPGTMGLRVSSLELPGGLEPLGAAVLFRGTTAASGQELWRTDGTEGGTVQVLDILPGTGSSSPEQITTAGSIAFFSAADGSGRELWKTDGTAAGTARVKDIRPGTASSMRLGWDHPEQSDERFATVGGTVFFPADDGAAGEELWKSDGTAAGTVLVKDILPGAGSSEIRWLTAAGGRVYFVADDGANGRELWVSDGTAAGTVVLDLRPGPESSVPQSLFALNPFLFFSAADGTHGRELWRSDGSPDGTFQVQDIAPGALSSTPIYFTPSGTNFYFFANDNTTGFELWAAPTAAVLARFHDVPLGHWAWGSVEALAKGGILTGCAPGRFCPLLGVSRAEMSVFLVRALRGPQFVPPPATGKRYVDVPADFWAAPYIEQLAVEGIAQGCGLKPPRFCPLAPMTRAEIAVFLLRSLHGAKYAPPPATGKRYADVPASHPAAAWIEQLAAEGIALGCSRDRYCPEDPINRAHTAVFLGSAFE